MKFNVPAHLKGPAKLAEMTRQAARAPLKITLPSKPLLQRTDEGARLTELPKAPIDFGTICRVRKQVDRFS